MATRPRQVMGLAQDGGQGKDLRSQGSSPVRVRYLGHAVQRANSSKHGSDLAGNRERLMREICAAFQITLLPHDITQIDQGVGNFSPVAKFSVDLQAFFKQQSSRSEIALYCRCCTQIAESDGER